MNDGFDNYAHLVDIQGKIMQNKVLINRKNDNYNLRFHKLLLWIKLKLAREFYSTL